MQNSEKTSKKITFPSIAPSTPGCRFRRSPLTIKIHRAIRFRYLKRKWKYGLGFNFEAF